MNHNTGMILSMKKAFAYLRVSGQGQVEGDGFPRQLKACKAFAAKNEIKLVRVFREEGVSGTKESAARPAFREMMLALLSNGVRTVVIERLDRLARDLMVQESMIAEFKRHGFELISTMEPDLGSTDPSRVAFRQMIGVFSQFEKSNIVLKLRGARERQKAKTGRCEGRKPYGEHEGEQPILERMKALRASRMAVDTIAATLNREGVQTRSGGLWFGSTVNKILKANATAL
jgi:DNA invertase Pin-like site-specific DNA recombinase